MVYMGLNIASSSAMGLYAWENRYGGILLDTPLRGRVRENLPSINQFYQRISPTIEHFAMGYAITSYGYGFKNFFDFNPGNGSVNPSTPVKIFASTVIGFDLLWEGYQSLVRKRILPEQFIGTCAGVLTSVALNNLDQIVLFTNAIKELF